LRDREADSMSEDLSEEFAQLALALHDQATLEETVETVVDFALKAVGCAHAGVLFVHRRKQVETVAATDEVVRQLDQLQFECGEGPDLDLITDRASVLVTDTRYESRWPTWAAKVAAAGINSMLGTRLYTTSTTIGSLNLYDPEPEHFDIADQQVAHVLARHAAVALSSARDNENLWRAIDARKLIGQAQGILMERYSIDADRAFALLRRYSQDTNTKLNVVAERLITTRRLPY